LLLALLGCSTSPRETPSSPSSPVASSALALAPPPPSARSSRESDPRWRRARDEDPAERQRLALAVGAEGLLEGFDEGGEIAAVALSALPYADDADIALGRLADSALGPSALRRPILEAVLVIAGRPRRSRELFDPEGMRRAAEAMLTLAARADLPREERALAISAARALAEKGYVDAKRIPGDLDPK
jgi:hypothetical protein